MHLHDRAGTLASRVIKHRISHTVLLTVVLTSELNSEGYGTVPTDVVPPEITDTASL